MSPPCLKDNASSWFETLRTQIVTAFEDIERAYATQNNLTPATFNLTPWDREDGGGGTIALMKGNVFEKVGVNISTVFGTFSEDFRQEIPGTESDPTFWASGISLVAHMKNPHVPAVHMNTRHIVTADKKWFGGGVI